MGKDAYKQQYGYDGWMGGIKCSDEKSWNVALITSRVVSLKDTAYYVDGRGS